MSNQVFEADLTWTGQVFEPGIQIEVSEGRIVSRGLLGLEPTSRLERQALLPGFVNAHSHAFQLGLRGRGELFPSGSGSFWTWRQAMYDLVSSLDEQAFFDLTLRAYREMLAAGITTVGEFHYLHHSAEGEDFAFDDLVLSAAESAGIRLVLLNVYYRSGGIGQELADGQRRFRTADPAQYWRRMDTLGARLRGPAQSLGAVAHSVRAATPEEIAAIHREARRRDMPFHIHLEEQRQEIEQCLEGYGKRPMALLNDTLDSLEGVTAVHCTHSDPQDMARFLAGGGAVCICPLTEANLGDGLADLEAVHRQGSICLGSDSNARISMLEEMRWLEYGQRLRSETRGRLADAEGRVAAELIRAACGSGADALALATGRIDAGAWADFVALDLDHPSLRGWEASTLAESALFGAPDDVICGTWVGGSKR